MTSNKILIRLAICLAFLLLGVLPLVAVFGAPLGSIQVNTNGIASLATNVQTAPYRVTWSGTVAVVSTAAAPITINGARVATTQDLAGVTGTFTNLNIGGSNYTSRATIKAGTSMSFGFDGTSVTFNASGVGGDLAALSNGLIDIGGVATGAFDLASGSSAALSNQVALAVMLTGGTWQASSGQSIVFVAGTNGDATGASVEMGPPGTSSAGGDLHLTGGYGDSIAGSVYLFSGTALGGGLGSIYTRGVIFGDGNGLSNLYASALAVGTVPLAALAGITSNQIAGATDAAYRNVETASPSPWTRIDTYEIGAPTNWITIVWTSPVRRIEVEWAGLVLSATNTDASLAGDHILRAQINGASNAMWLSELRQNGGSGFYYYSNLTTTAGMYLGALAGSQQTVGGGWYNSARLGQACISVTWSWSNLVSACGSGDIISGSAGAGAGQGRLTHERWSAHMSNTLIGAGITQMVIGVSSYTITNGGFIEVRSR
jgi:hypothetical protein